MSGGYSFINIKRQFNISNAFGGKFNFFFQKYPDYQNFGQINGMKYVTKAGSDYRNPMSFNIEDS